MPESGSCESFIYGINPVCFLQVSESAANFASGCDIRTASKRRIYFLVGFNREKTLLIRSFRDV